MKHWTFIIIIFSLFLVSCSRDIIGTYRHNICCYGPNCYILTLNKDNTFEYKYFHDLLGSGLVSGSYERKFNRLKLIPNTTTKDSLYSNWMTLNYKIRKNGLFPMTYEPEMAFFGNYSFFNKCKCLTSNDIIAIRDTLFKLIKINIDKSVFKEEIYVPDFIVTFKTNGKAKNIKITPSGQGWFYDWSFNFEERKILHKIKKAIKGYKIQNINDYGREINIKMEVNYNDKSDSLELWN